jgi:hypothetical protein
MNYQVKTLLSLKEKQIFFERKTIKIVKISKVGVGKI